MAFGPVRGIHSKGERAHLALLGAAQRRIDLMQNAFSSSLNCWAAYLQPGGCAVDEWPLYLRSCRPWRGTCACGYGCGC